MNKIVFCALLVGFASFGLNNASAGMSSLTQSLTIASETGLNPQDINVSGNKNLHQELDLLFGQAVSATESDVDGAFSGRCYSKDNPTQPVGIFLVGKYLPIESTEDNGPLFPPSPGDTTFNFALANSSGLATPPEKYDVLNEELKRVIKSFLNSAQFKAAVAYSANGSLITEGSDSNAHMRYSLRKHKSYIIGRVVALDDRNKSEIYPYFAYCYFFKKLTL